MATEGRLGWVSNLRGLAIMAVVVGHMATPLTRFIFSWHMPLFFFLSGYLMKGGIRQTIKKDVRRLLVPYLIFGLIAIGAEWTKRSFFPGFHFLYESFSVKDEMVSLLLWMDAGKIHTYGFALWFLPALFFSKAILLLIRKYLKNKYLVLALTLLVWMLMVNQKMIWWWGLDKTLLALVWVQLGLVYRTVEEKVTNNWLAVAIGVMAIFLPVPYFDMAFKVAISPIYCFVYAMLMMYLLTTIFKKFNFTKVFEIWGEGSMLVYLIHPYVNNMGYILITALKLNWIFEVILVGMFLFIALKIKKYVGKTRYASISNWI